MVEGEGMVRDRRRSRRKKKRQIPAAGEKESERRWDEWGAAGNGRTVRISILFTRDIPQSQGRGSENRIG